uniref:Uncharacterized protein n=1 Tax=viral metagenome TaxID=1070528 RepID=A0A6C0IU31_9ZZZZ
MSSLNSIEKLIQMATIEQMYAILNKMKNDTNASIINEHSNENNIKNSSSQIQELNNDNSHQYSEQLNFLSSKLQKVESKLDCILTQMSLLNKIEPIYGLVNQMVETQNTIHATNHVLLLGQTKMTDYLQNYQVKKPIDIPVLDLTNCDIKIKEEHNISLVISDPEKTTRTGETDIVVNLVSDEETEEQELIDEVLEEEESMDDNQYLVTSEKDVEEAKDADEEEQEQEQEEQPEQLVSEEEVETEEEEQIEEEEQVNVEEKKVEETKIKKEDEEEVEEEVFEIEIDDVTYYATDENNGILYEATEDGDVGKKVGIIKDGEPIFDE